jgi:hypothetical protein
MSQLAVHEFETMICSVKASGEILGKEIKMILNILGSDAHSISQEGVSCKWLDGAWE